MPSRRAPRQTPVVTNAGVATQDLAPENDATWGRGLVIGTAVVNVAGAAAARLAMRATAAAAMRGQE